MKKKYTLDYNIQRDTDRVAAIYDILDKLEKDPSPLELEQMGSYILYGKDENGLNAAKRGQIMTNNTRYNSYRKKEDKNLSLDALIENPLTDNQAFQNLTEKRHYTVPKPTITRPRYDRKSGALIDAGDSDIPGMTDLWQSIDRIQRWIHILEGKLAPDESTLLFDDSYRLYQLKHMLIELRRSQYYLKDAYKPALHFAAIDHPKAQFIDWTSDSCYWMPLADWQQRVNNSLLHTISKKLSDYETRKNPCSGEIQVKWVVRRHTFNWEDPQHVRALINNLDLLRDYVHDKLDTYSRTLIFDFQRYRKMANLSQVREWLLDQKIMHTPYPLILEQLNKRYGLTYNENYLSAILSVELPRKIAEAAQRDRIIIDTPPSELKHCCQCGRMLPRVPMFYTRNRSRRDGYSSTCKECEKRLRIRRGGQGKNDRRSKDATMPTMQGNEA